MATSVWKGFLNFGLVSIGIKMATAARDKGVELHQYHTCGSRIKCPKQCPACNRLITDAEITKGYETGKDSFVPITKDEIAAILPASEKVMEIQSCVSWGDVDPTYLAESFYLLPEAPSKKAYSLLVQALADSGRVAITQLTKNNREHVVLIRPKGNGLVAHFLYYGTEVNRVAEFDDLPQTKLTASEMKLARQLVDNLDATFEPDEFENGYDQRLETLIASKIDKNVAAPAPVRQAAMQAMPDITSALQASLNRPKRKIALPESKAKGKKRAA